MLDKLFTSFEDQQQFEKWAFGKVPVCYDLAALYSWNSHHGDLYFAKSNEKIKFSIEKMYMLYKENMHKKIMEKASKALDKDAKHYEKDVKAGKDGGKKVEAKEAKSASKDLKARAKKAHEY